MSTTKEISIGDIAAQGAEASAKLDGDKMALNVGPSHPTTHGVLRLIMELNGDIIDKCEPVLGYLPRVQRRHRLYRSSRSVGCGNFFVAKKLARPSSKRRRRS